MNALGAETPQEALNLMKANGLSSQDIQKLLNKKNYSKNSNSSNNNQMMPVPPEEVKLSRR